MLAAVLEALPDSQTLTTLLDRYADILISAIKDVDEVHRVDIE